MRPIFIALFGFTLTTIIAIVGFKDLWYNNNNGYLIIISIFIGCIHIIISITALIKKEVVKKEIGSKLESFQSITFGSIYLPIIIFLLFLIPIKELYLSKQNDISAIINTFFQIIQSTIFIALISFILGYKIRSLPFKQNNLLIYLSYKIKKIFKKPNPSDKKELIFEDDFSYDKGWRKHYWNGLNPEKTNRLENNSMVFEATEIEWKDTAFQENRNGAFIDLKNGIYENNYYEVSCIVKSEKNTTMGFQLWVHDTTPNGLSSFNPIEMKTPSIIEKEIKLTYIATSSKAIRIHLHCSGGNGKIIVKNVKVYKVK